MKSIQVDFYEPSPALRELQILSIVSHNPGISQKGIAAEVGLVPSMVHNYLHGLAAKGMLDFQGPSRRRMRYLLTQAGEERLRSLAGRHAEEACRVVEQIGEWIRDGVVRAAGEGVRRIGVLNCPALADTFERVGRESGLEIRALIRGADAGNGISGESLAGLDAIFVAADPAREEVQRALTVAAERGLPVHIFN